MRSVVSVCLSLSTLAFEQTGLLPFHFCMHDMGHDHISSGIKCQGHRSRLRIRVRVSKDGNVVGLTSILNGGLFVFQCGTIVDKTWNSLVPTLRSYVSRQVWIRLKADVFNPTYTATRRSRGHFYTVPTSSVPDPS